MNRQTITKFLIFFLLFAGIVEAEPATEDEKDNVITVFGAFNTFTVSSCSTTDKYIQGSVGAKYDRKLDENVSMHVSGTYSRSKRIAQEFDPDDENDKPSDLERIYNSGMGSLGVSYSTKYFRMRTDFMLSMWKEYFKEEPDQFIFKPMGGLLLEAGKMDFMWISTGIFHPEYPFGMIQIAFNVKIKNVEFGGGQAGWLTNITTWRKYEDSTSLFLRARAEFGDTFALRGIFNLKPGADLDQMFEGSLGLEFSF
jgi:hypothetical protein